ncbi:MAG: polysaccharide deacetylase [Eubacteriales bacterium]|nr:polysaccharide deacetylase [Eubacteriales bacterium]
MKDAVKWPDGYQSAAMVSIMLDAEYIWLSMGREYDTPKHRSMGEYGITRGVERILNLLERYEIKATFFVPAVIAEVYPETLRKIHDCGHELALHGYRHENFAGLNRYEQKHVLETGIRLMEDMTGVRPVGFRLPEGGCGGETLEVIEEAGFLYDSSFSDHDVPYLMEGKTKNGRLTEIPFRWEMLDFIYFAWGGGFPKGESRIAVYDDVLENWMYELEGHYNRGYCYVITFTPQITGTPGRIFMMEKILEQLKKRNIWVAQGREIAEYIQNT